MSGKQSKRLRRLEAAQSAQAEALAALEAKRQELRQEALDRALRERREARRRLAEAERARTVWKTGPDGGHRRGGPGPGGGLAPGEGRYP